MGLGIRKEIEKTLNDSKVEAENLEDKKAIEAALAKYSVYMHDGLFWGLADSVGK